MIGFRGPVRRSGDGFVVDVGADEAALIARLAGELRTLLTEEAETESARALMARLFPAAYPDDEELEAEYQRTRDAVRAIRDTEAPLANNPVLRASISLRNPYVDPLSLLQISLLRRKRNGLGHPDLDRALGTTLNGVAQGLRNTG